MKLHDSLSDNKLSTAKRLVILSELSLITKLKQDDNKAAYYKQEAQILFIPFLHHAEKLNELLKECKQIIDDIEVWLEMLGTISFELAANSLAETIPICEKIFDIASNYRLENPRGYGLRALGLYYRKIGNLKKSEYYCRDYLALHQKTGNLKGIGAALNNLGLLAKRKGEHNRALDYFAQSTSIRESINDEVGLGSSTNNMGLIYLGRRAFGDALPCFLKSLKSRQKLGDRKNESKVYLNNGLIYFWQEMYSQALSYYNKSLKIREELNLEKGIAAIQINMASIYFQQKNYETALQFFEKSLVIKEKIQDKHGITLCLHNIGECYIVLNQLEKALEYSERALAKKKALEDYTGILESYLVIGSIHDKLGNIKQATSFLEQALELALKKEHRPQLIEISELLSDLYAKQKKYKRAYELQKMAKRIHTILLKELNSEQFSELQVRFDTEQKEKEIQLQKLELEKQELELKQKEKLEELNVQLEIIVKKRTSQLEQRNQQLEQFAYIAAHDLKEPLRTVGSFVTLLQKRYAEQMPHTANTFLQSIFDQVQNMYQLLEDLLSYSTLDQPDEALQIIDVKQLLEEIIIQQLRAAIEESGAEVIIEPLPNIKIRKPHLLQLFINLISNAIKFRKKDVPCVVRISSITTNSGAIQFKIQDNGIGIAAEHQQKIFRIFNRLEKQKYEGTGIGLAICNKIVEIYEGKIWVESEEGKGSCFMIEFGGEDLALEE